MIEELDPDFGPVLIQIWKGLRFKQALNFRMVVAQVEQAQAPVTRHLRRLFRLTWVGAEPLNAGDPSIPVVFPSTTGTALLKAACVGLAHATLP